MIGLISTRYESMYFSVKRGSRPKTLKPIDDIGMLSVSTGTAEVITRNSVGLRKDPITSHLLSGPPSKPASASVHLLQSLQDSCPPSLHLAPLLLLQLHFFCFHLLLFSLLLLLFYPPLPHSHKIHQALPHPHAPPNFFGPVDQYFFWDPAVLPCKVEAFFAGRLQKERSSGSLIERRPPSKAEELRSWRHVCWRRPHR